MSSNDFYTNFSACTVGIVTGGNVVGTGFFAAPARVITCAHVVASLGNRVDIRWNMRTFPGAVEKAGNPHSLLNSDEGASPDPDLAIIQLEQAAFGPDTQHPCMFLSRDTPQVGDTFYAYGHAEGEYVENGEALTLAYDGPANDAMNRPMLNLKGGNVLRGMSGSPLLNLRTGRVNAALFVSRGTGLGGRGIPISFAWEMVPELAKSHDEYHEKSSRWTALWTGTGPAVTAPSSLPGAPRAAEQVRRLRMRSPKGTAPYSRNEFRVLFADVRDLSNLGHKLAETALRARGLEHLDSKKDQSPAFGSLIATERNKEYVIEVVTRSKYKDNGQISKRIKWRKGIHPSDGPDSHEYWIAVRVDLGAAIYCVYFGSVNKLRNNRSRQLMSGIPLRDSDVRERGYECLADSRPIFLCHSLDDRQRVRKLYDKLSADGFVPWLDPDDILPGWPRAVEIKEAVRASRALVVCLSTHSVTQAGDLHEGIKFVLEAAEEKIAARTIFLIPLRLEVCDVPENLSGQQWADLFVSGGYKKLVDSLRTQQAQTPF